MAFLIVQRKNFCRNKLSQNSLLGYLPLITFLCYYGVCTLLPPLHSTPSPTCIHLDTHFMAFPIVCSQVLFSSQIYLFLPNSALPQIRLIWPTIKSWRASARWSVVIFGILHLKNRLEEWSITLILESPPRQRGHLKSHAFHNFSTKWLSITPFYFPKL